MKRRKNKETSGFYDITFSFFFHPPQVLFGNFKMVTVGLIIWTLNRITMISIQILKSLNQKEWIPKYYEC